MKKTFESLRRWAISLSLVFLVMLFLDAASVSHVISLFWEGKWVSKGALFVYAIVFPISLVVVPLLFQKLWPSIKDFFSELHHLVLVFLLVLILFLEKKFKHSLSTTRKRFICLLFLFWAITIYSQDTWLNESPTGDNKGIKDETVILFMIALITSVVCFLVFLKCKESWKEILQNDELLEQEI